MCVDLPAADPLSVGAVVDIKQIVAGERLPKSLVLTPSFGVQSPGDPVVFGPTKARLGTTSLSVAKCREGVLVVLAHELFHFVQYWKMGDMKLSQQRYTNTFNRLREEAKRKNPQLSDAEARARAHARHPSEQQAERIAQQQIAKFKTDINRGAWDKFVPMQDLKWYTRQ